MAKQKVPCFIAVHLGPRGTDPLHGVSWTMEEFREWRNRTGRGGKRIDKKPLKTKRRQKT